MDRCEALAIALGQSQHAVAFTGAGISTESGIPAYRGQNGLWSRYDPNLYASISHFRKDPAYYWAFFRDVRYPLLKKAKPNGAHLALAELGQRAKLKSVITQNIDGLHQDAGSDRVFELHGTTRTICCVGCGRKYSIDEAFSFLDEGLPALCSGCGGILRPAVVFFGEPLDPRVLQLAGEEVDACDLFLIVGSSLTVHPAADLPVRAKQAGARLAIINLEPTSLDDLADIVLHGKAVQVLSDLVEIFNNRWTCLNP